MPIWQQYIVVILLSYTILYLLISYQVYSHIMLFADKQLVTERALRASHPIDNGWKAIKDVFVITGRLECTKMEALFIFLDLTTQLNIMLYE